MPIAKPWSVFNSDKVSEVPSVFGVYELGNRAKNVIRIGSGNLRERLAEHLRSKNSCIRRSKYFRYEKTSGKEKSLQRERALQKKYKEMHGKLPDCNERLG